MDVRGQHEAAVALPLEAYPDIYGVRRVGGPEAVWKFRGTEISLTSPGLYSQDIALNQITPGFSCKLSNQFSFVISGVKCSSVKCSEVE